MFKGLSNIINIRALICGVTLTIATIAVTVTSTVANAGLIVDTIRVSNAVNQWLQVSEVIAWSSSGNSDVALSSSGASAIATDYYQFLSGSCGAGVGAGAGVSAACVLDGVGPLSFYASPFIYHGGSASGSSILTVSLAQSTELDFVTILGRTDCCSDRDVYDIELLNNQTTVASFSSVRAGDRASLVPVPATFALLGLGLVGLSRRRKA